MCDIERIALYLNDDLADAERRQLEAHLAECDPCRAALAKLRADVATVSSWYDAPSLRRVAAPARRRWWPAAAALVVLVLFFGAARVDAVGARLVELFPFLHIKVMPVEEANRYANERTFVPDTAPITPPPRSTAEEAEHQVGFHVPRPAYLPSGFAADNVSVSKGENWAVVSQSFAKPGMFLVLSQEHFSGRTRQEIPVPDGSGREVQVNGEPAMLVNGAWRVEADGSKVWDSEGVRYLWFQWEGQTMSISVHRVTKDAALPPGDELIKMAASLK